ncbi:putative HVA22-like protein g isoform X1 [Physcomitrium patens]|uniref:HVA22-like protein n=2 Tax=Physcomitrium patens TaxID=3218 RepID=A0A2K1J8Q5_PHYPA|nr:putative HVA22-like protein g isoform X1 [Physcomitrium patens]PNR37906.1 hypothetical protein PHYPA_021016 [Physcomitrium patens]|eukprot:XP_024399110.1 putative HVA22-like protein g isoform X1 [Physcomitrella patens]
MMVSFITRGIIMLLGYVYPAYACFKVVERDRPDLEHLQFWCQYWIIIAALTVFERLGDVLVSWVPMYSEAKLAFIVYLWHPNTLGTKYVYSTFLRPIVARHEAEIDHHLHELTTRGGDLAYFWWQKCSNYAQSRIYELFSYVASQPNRTQQGSIARQSRRRPNFQGPPRGPPRDPYQGGPQVYPPAPPAGYPGSTRAGYPPVNANTLEDSDSDYHVVEKIVESRPEGRPEGGMKSRSEQEVPPHVGNIRERVRADDSGGSRYLYGWLPGWFGTSSGKED